jgi:hypothetical protein
MRKDGRTGGQTDVMKLRIAFRNIANAPKQESKLIFKTQTINGPA